MEIIDATHLLRLARDLCDDAPAEHEYVRGQAELFCDAVGISMQHKEAIQHLLTEYAYPTPDRLTVRLYDADVEPEDVPLPVLLRLLARDEVYLTTLDETPAGCDFWRRPRSERTA